MKADLTTGRPDNVTAPTEPVRRGGSIALVLLIAVAEVALAVGFLVLGRSQAQPIIQGVL